jgi:hypothetical protein
MLFFFEMFLFVLVMLTLALGEFVSRWLALVLWLVVTVFTLFGYLLARQSLRGIITEGDAAGPASPAAAVPPPAGASPAAGVLATDAASTTDEPESAPGAQPVADPPRLDAQPAAPQQEEYVQDRVSPEGMTAAPREVTPLDAKWARTMLYNWRRTNALLLLGVVVVGGWYWLGG